MWSRIPIVRDSLVRRWAHRLPLHLFVDASDVLCSQRGEGQDDAIVE